MNKAYIKMVRKQSRKDRFEGYLVNTIGYLAILGGACIALSLAYGFTVVMLAS